MTGVRATWGMLLVLSALPSIGDAQAPVLVPGARVRITGPCLAELPSGPAQCNVAVGRLRSWTHDSVIIDAESRGGLAFARRDTKRIEVSDGIRSRKRLGTVVGAGVGLAVGLVAPCVRQNGGTGSQTFDYVGCTWVRMYAVPFAMVAGAGLGWTAGLLLRSERWASVARNTATIGIVPVANAGVGLSITVRL